MRSRAPLRVTLLLLVSALSCGGRSKERTSEDGTAARSGTTSGGGAGNGGGGGGVAAGARPGMGGTGAAGAATGGASRGGTGGRSAGGTAGTPLGGSGGTAEGGAAGEAGSAGAPDDGRCEAGEVRCHPTSGIRERCAEELWVEEDFVCATSVRVEDDGGRACAVKADGQFECWSSGGDLFFGAKPTHGNQVKSVYALNGFYWESPAPYFHFVDGLFLDDQGGANPGVIAYDRTYYGNLCLVTEDGTAACTSGSVPFDAVTDVAVTPFLVCVRLENDEAWCQPDGASYEFVGSFRAIAAGSIFLCGVALDGRVLCTNPVNQLDFEPPEGLFTAIAMSDESVCAIRDTGAIACAGPPDSTPLPPDGSFTQIDAGDHQYCAIATDGSVHCWYDAGSATPVPDGW